MMARGRERGWAMEDRDQIAMEVRADTRAELSASDPPTG
jgi:hypothetical protein